MPAATRPKLINPLTPSQTTLSQGGGPAPVTKVQIYHKTSLWGYKGDKPSPFIKITTSDLKCYPRIRAAFERDGLSYKDFFNGGQVTTFESNIAYTLRFMIDHEIVGMNWLEIPAGKWTTRSDADKVSTCQIEVDCQ